MGQVMTSARSSNDFVAIPLAEKGVCIEHGDRHRMSR